MRPGAQRSSLSARRCRVVAVTAGCDYFHIWERMHTIFQFYLETWDIFSGVAAAAAYELWRS